MPNTATVQVRLPFDWLTKIQALAQQRDRALEEILQEAIAQYLGVPVPNQAARLGELETEVSSLKTQLKQLNQTLGQLQHQALLSPPLTPDVATPEPAIATPQFNDPRLDDPNWVDDEPDEVLLDFLPPDDPRLS